MKKGIKVSLIVVTVLLVLVGLLGLGLYGLARKINKERSCDWGNIDNIEMYSDINIPKVAASNCVYIKEEHVKITCFDLDTSRVDVDRYLKRNPLTPFSSSDSLVFDARLVERSHLLEWVDTGHAFYKKGENDGASYQVLLNRETGLLCVFLAYKVW